MNYQFVLRKFNLNQSKLENKIRESSKGKFSVDNATKRIQFTGDLDLTKVSAFNEIENILIMEKESSLLNLEGLRKDLLEIGKKLDDFKLEIKAYCSLNIKPSSLRKRLTGYLLKSKINVNEKSGNTLLIEMLKDNKKINYRIFSYKSAKNNSNKTEYSHLAALIENPRLVDEVSDFLRLSLIFGLKLKVIHEDEKKFNSMLNNAKSITKGNLSSFNVEVVKDLNNIKGFIKVGFTKHAGNDEKDLIKFFKENKNKNILLIFGNDLYGLTQGTRDKLNYSFSLTPDKVKPLKGNQALSYVLGIYSSLNQ